MPVTRPLTIAMIGQKGLPATWGGIEHHVEEVGARLAARGHDVVVYVRPNYTEDTRRSYRGMRLVPVRSVDSKHLDAISHSLSCSVRALRDGVDVVHYHAVGPGLVAPLPRYLSGSRVVLTVHGLDSRRDKWGLGAKLVLRQAEWVSAHVPHETVVVSSALREHYASAYGRATTWIPNGVDVPGPTSPDRLRDALGLGRGPYVLFVGRIVPEKCPDLLLEAFARVPGDVRLVLAGGSSFSDDYSDAVHRAAARDPRVLLPGYLHGQDLADLYSGAAAFVLPSAVEGLPLTLLEAASHGVPVIASDIAPHLEVLGADGPGRRVVPQGDVPALAAALVRVLQDLPEECAGAAQLRRSVLERYQWDVATTQLEEVYRRATRSASRSS